MTKDDNTNVYIPLDRRGGTEIKGVRRSRGRRSKRSRGYELLEIKGWDRGIYKQKGGGSKKECVNMYFRTVERSSELHAVQKLVLKNTTLMRGESWRLQDHAVI